MPKKTIEVIPCDMTQRQNKEYNSLIEYYKRRKDQLLKEAADKENEKAEKAKALADRINSEKASKMDGGSSSVVAAAASAKFNDVFDIIEADLNRKKAKNDEKKAKENEDSSSNIIMELRKGANHPLLRRTIYTDEKLKQMAKLIMKESSADTVFEYVVEDMSVLNDFQIHKLCPLYKVNKNKLINESSVLKNSIYKYGHL